jgi:hypothetical protein
MKEGQRIPNKTAGLEFGSASPGSLYAQEATSDKEIFREWARRESRRKEVFFYAELALIAGLCTLFGSVLWGNFPPEVKVTAGAALMLVLRVVVQHLVKNN